MIKKNSGSGPLRTVLLLNIVFLSSLWHPLFRRHFIAYSSSKIHVQLFDNLYIFWPFYLLGLCVLSKRELVSLNVYHLWRTAVSSAWRCIAPWPRKPGRSRRWSRRRTWSSRLASSRSRWRRWRCSRRRKRGRSRAGIRRCSWPESSGMSLARTSISSNTA